MMLYNRVVQSDYTAIQEYARPWEWYDLSPATETTFLTARDGSELFVEFWLDAVWVVMWMEG